MLVLPGEIHNLGHLCFGDLVSVNAADPDSSLVHMEHDASRLLPALIEEPFENVNDKLHWSVIVIQHKHLVHGGFLRLRLCLDDDTRSRSFLAAFSVVAHFGPSRWRCSLSNDIGFQPVQKSLFRPPT